MGWDLESSHSMQYVLKTKIWQNKTSPPHAISRKFPYIEKDQSLYWKTSSSILLKIVWLRGLKFKTMINPDIGLIIIWYWSWYWSDIDCDIDLGNGLAWSNFAFEFTAQKEFCNDFTASSQRKTSLTTSSQRKTSFTAILQRFYSEFTAQNKVYSEFTKQKRGYWSRIDLGSGLILV